jgi:AcrR family transcriptional regulator
MKRIANNAPRTYRSKLRAQQAEETRARILDATMRVMAGGFASLSIPAVATEAGVSVPTVYRHFATKEQLLAALYPYSERRAGLREMPLPGSVAEIGDTVRAIFERVESFDDLARAAMASPSAEEARRLSLPRRLGLGRQLLDTVRPPLPPDARDRIARLLVVLLTSSSLRVWRQLDATVDEAANDIQWILRAAVAHAREEADR